MKTRRRGVILLLGLCSTRAGAQGAPAAPPEGLQPSTRAAIVALGDSLEREGLPRGPLYDRAAEGVLKRADDARILSVVRSLAQRLREARSALGPGAREPELLAAASALFAGVQPEVVRRVAAPREGRPTSSLAVALTVLADLVANERVPADVAAVSMEALLAKGARDLDLTELQRVVKQDIRGGRVPRDAVRERTEGLLGAIERRRPDS